MHGYLDEVDRLDDVDIDDDVDTDDDVETELDVEMLKWEGTIITIYIKFSFKTR